MTNRYAATEPLVTAVVDQPPSAEAGVLRAPEVQLIVAACEATAIAATASAIMIFFIFFFFLFVLSWRVTPCHAHSNFFYNAEGITIDAPSSLPSTRKPCAAGITRSFWGWANSQSSLRYQPATGAPSSVVT